jgi:hypothetical protein
MKKITKKALGSPAGLDSGGHTEQTQRRILAKRDYSKTKTSDYGRRARGR